MVLCHALKFHPSKCTQQLYFTKENYEIFITGTSAREVLRQNNDGTTSRGKCVFCNWIHRLASMNWFEGWIVPEPQYSCPKPKMISEISTQSMVQPWLRLACVSSTFPFFLVKVMYHHITSRQRKSMEIRFRLPNLLILMPPSVIGCKFVCI